MTALAAASNNAISTISILIAFVFVDNNFPIDNAGRDDGGFWLIMAEVTGG